MGGLVNTSRFVHPALLTRLLLNRIFFCCLLGCENLHSFEFEFRAKTDRPVALKAHLNSGTDAASESAIF